MNKGKVTQIRKLLVRLGGKAVLEQFYRVDADTDSAQIHDVKTVKNVLKTLASNLLIDTTLTDDELIRVIDDFYKIMSVITNLSADDEGDFGFLCGLSESFNLELFNKKMESINVTWGSDDDTAPIQEVVTNVLNIMRHDTLTNVQNKILAMSFVELDEFKKVDQTCLSKLDEKCLFSEEEIKALQILVDKRLFEFKVDDCDGFGFSAHPKLLDAFQKLGNDKKEILLGSTHTALHDLLNTKDRTVIKSYFDEAFHVETVLKENNRLSSCKKIHNAPLAKMLAESEPIITLDSDKIQLINELCFKFVLEHLKHSEFLKHLESLEHLKNLENLENLKQLEHLENLKHLENLDIIFNNDQLPFFQSITENNKRVLISDFKNKEELFRFLFLKMTPAEKAVLVALLNLEGSIVYNDKMLDGITKALNARHNNVNEFINELSNAIPDANDKYAFKKALSKKLSQWEYDDIYFHHIQSILSVSGPEEKKQIEKDIEKKCNELVKQQNELLANTNKLNELNEKIYLLTLKENYNLYEYLKESPQQKAQGYKELLDDNERALEQLRRNINTFDRYRLCINESELQKSLDNYSVAANDQLKQRADIQTNLNKMLTEIQSAIDEKQYLYTAEGITIKVATGNPSTPSKDIIVNLSATSSVSNFHTALVKVDYNSNYQYVVREPNSVGAFNLAVAKRDMSADNKVPDFKITTQQPPINPNTKHLSSSEAQVKFYMDMALAAVVAHGGRPTKEKPLYLRGTDAQQIELLWSAFKALGDRFNFEDGAINMDHSRFKPTTGWFTSELVLHNAFRSSKDVLDAKLNDAKILLGDVDQNKAVIGQLSMFYNELNNQTKGDVANKLNNSVDKNPSEALKLPDATATPTGSPT